MRVLFVCLGNICRSPLAEGVFRDHVDRAGLADSFEVASAGTAGWHVGDRPDARMLETARRHGIELSSRGRQLRAEDLESHDLLLAMDRDNLHDILYLDPEGRFADKVRLFREFDPDPGDWQVPDPYYGGPEGFEQVFDIVDRTCRALLGALAAHVRVAG